MEAIVRLCTDERHAMIAPNLKQLEVGGGGVLFEQLQIHRQEVTVACPQLEQ
jgi:hypothetical protein